MDGILASQSTEEEVFSDAAAEPAAPATNSALAAKKKSGTRKNGAKKSGAKKNGATISNGSGDMSKGSDDMLREKGGVGTTK